MGTGAAGYGCPANLTSEPRATFPKISKMSELKTGSIPHAREGRVATEAPSPKLPALAPAEPIQLSLGGDMRMALAAYADQALGTRLFLRGRHLLCPMMTVAREVPVSGRILDIGCGHGLFTALLASGSSLRTIVGIDPSESKIAVARGSTKAFPNISYIQGSVLDHHIDQHGKPYDAITILDVLYLLPDQLVRDILAHARALLKDDGVFLLKTNDIRPRWKYALVRSEEFLMVKLLRYTLGGELHFRGSEQYLRMLDDAGFIAAVHKIDNWRPAPHRLFICRPK